MLRLLLKGRANQDGRKGVKLLDVNKFPPRKNKFSRSGTTNRNMLYICSPQIYIFKLSEMKKVIEIGAYEAPEAVCIDIHVEGGYGVSGVELPDFEGPENEI